MQEMVERQQPEDGEGLEETIQGKYLTFLLGNESYGLEIRYVTGIIGLQHMTEIPDLPDYVQGIINLRGKIIPVIDVRLKFRKARIAHTERTRVIVVHIGEVSMGLIVDKVAEVVNILADQIVPMSGGRTGFHNPYISGIGKTGSDEKLLVDCNRILTLY